LDGGTGEELTQRYGIPEERQWWSAAYVLLPEHHEKLQNVHRSYLQAGSQGLTTNTYGIIPRIFEKETTTTTTTTTTTGTTTIRTTTPHDDEQWIQSIGVAGKLAKDVIQDFYSSNHHRALLWGSLPPLVESYRPDQILPRKEGILYYRSMTKSLLPYVDCFLAETMSCSEEIIQVLHGVTIATAERITGTGETAETTAETGNIPSTHTTTTNDTPTNHVPLFISFTLSSDGNLRSGESLVYAISQLLHEMDNLPYHPTGVRLLGILLNCSEPEAITKALEAIRCHQTLSVKNSKNTNNNTNNTNNNNITRDPPLLLGAYANRLTPIDPNWTFDESSSPQPQRKDISPQEYYDQFVSHWIKEYQIQIIGGCCGITPKHIQYLHDKLQPNLVSLDPHKTHHLPLEKTADK
jgi:S-methylmethionine-dependent homocysteine/selenocysteine methylase